MIKVQLRACVLNAWTIPIHFRASNTVNHIKMRVASTMVKTDLHVLFLLLFYFGVKTYHAEHLNRLQPPKKYVIDLDLPEEQRWNEVAMDHSEIVGSFNDIIR